MSFYLEGVLRYEDTHGRIWNIDVFPDGVQFGARPSDNNHYSQQIEGIGLPDLLRQIEGKN